MRIEKFVFGPVGTNCYIVINEMTSECFAVDMADCPQEFVKHIKADTQIETAGFQVEIIPTPGHTEGGCCYYIGEEHVLFSGDTLFHNSIGRTDLPTGSGSELVRSVREKLLVLPEDTRVYPGHMEETTISHEKKYNPFI